MNYRFLRRMIKVVTPPAIAAAIREAKSKSYINVFSAICRGRYPAVGAVLTESVV